MNFPKQIVLEIKTILRSRFIFITAIVTLALAVIIPIASKAMDTYTENLYARYTTTDYGYYGSDGSEEITYNGITINGANYLFYNVQNVSDTLATLRAGDPEDSFGLSDAALQEAIAMGENQMDFLMSYAAKIENAAYSPAMDFIYEAEKWSIYDYCLNSAQDLEVLGSAAALFAGDIRPIIIEATEEERAVLKQQVESNLANLQKYVDNEDVEAYCIVKEAVLDSQIDDYQAQIKDYEAEIIKTPSKEESLNKQIEDIEVQIRQIEEIEKKTLEYRRKYQLAPSYDYNYYSQSWQELAIQSISDNNSSYIYSGFYSDSSQVGSQEEFNANASLVEQYGTYQKYLTAMEKQELDREYKINMAVQSLDSGKPDIAYVTKGARYKAFNFLSYSFVPMLFAVMVGGWIIANEFQNGTIRLLLIRPKSRLKILFAKFFAAASLSVLLFLAACMINIIVCGLMFGFGDYALPKYLPTGQVSFFVFYVPRMLACIAPIVFLYTLAFVFSVTVHNTAVAVIIPTVFYIGSSIMNTFITAYSTAATEWFFFTPFAFMNIASIFSNDVTSYSYFYNIGSGASPNLAIGIVLLLGFSVIFTAIAALSFRRQEITN